jgi:aminocarboxymuconate-semialdehyde decarboxylase
MLHIDIHTHIMPERMPNWAEKFGYGGFIHLDHHKHGCARMMKDDHFFREVEANCWDPGVRMEECDHQHVDVQVLSTIPVLFSYWAKPQDALDVSRFLNDHIAGIVNDFPHRFVGLGTVPLQDPALAIREMERCIRELGMAGIEIGTHVNGLNLDDPGIFEVFQAAEELGAAVFVHPWDMMSKERMGKYWMPWLVGMPAETTLAICSMLFSGVFEKLPNLRVAFAHGGGSFPATFGRIEHGFNVRPDLVAIDNERPPREYLGQFFFDSHVSDPEMLRYLVDLVGANRVALGTDYPFPLGELEPGKLINESGFDEATQKLLFEGAALEWLNMTPDQFKK